MLHHSQWGFLKSFPFDIYSIQQQAKLDLSETFLQSNRLSPQQFYFPYLTFSRTLVLITLTFSPNKTRTLINKQLPPRIKLIQVVTEPGYLRVKFIHPDCDIAEPGARIT